MSNAFPFGLLAYLLLPQVILAGPHSTASLPIYLTNNVPACAHRCLESYIVDNYNTSPCRDTQDIECLCKSKTTSGFTLGEGALSCLASYCSESVLEHSINVYELCAFVENARPMTHGTLTVTQVVATTVAHTSHAQTTTLPHSIGHPLSSSLNLTHSSSTHARSSSSRTNSISSSSPTHSISSSVSPILPLSTTQLTSVRPSVTSIIVSPASSSAVSKPQPALTKSQIAGITVAGVASAALAFGVLLCIFCFPRKDKKWRNSGLSFGCDKIISSRPGSPMLPQDVVADLEHGDGSVGPNRPTFEYKTGRWSFWRKSTKPEDIGVAVGPQALHLTPPTENDPTLDEAPASARSFRTPSQLLPDKPTYSLFPQTLRIINPSTSPISPQTPDSSETCFTDVAGPAKPAPRGRNALDTSQRSLQQVPKVVRPSSSDPFLDSHVKPQDVASSEESSGNGMSPWAQSFGTVHKPLPAHGPPTTPYHQRSARPLKHSLQIPTAYADGPEYGVRGQSWGSAATRRNSFARPLTHYSTASDTSFEEAAEEDELLTLQPALSAVAESPTVQSPPGQVRYPKVPGTIPPLNTRRPSSESPTRRPPLKNPKGAAVARTTKHKRVVIPQPQVAELYGSPVSPQEQWGAQPPSTESLKGSANCKPDTNAPSAKWQILVKPGLEGIGNVTNPKEKLSPLPNSGKTGESRVSDRSRRPDSGLDTD